MRSLGRMLTKLAVVLIGALLVVGLACGGGEAKPAAPKTAPPAPAAAPKPATAPAQQPAAPAAQPKPAAPPGGAQFAALVEAARKEAQANSTVYLRVTGMQDKTLELTEKALKEKFGINVKFINEQKGYAGAVAAYVAETQAGKKNLPNIFGVYSGILNSLYEVGGMGEVDWHGLFDEKWPVVAKLSDAITWPNLRRSCLDMTWAVYVVMYNTSLLPPDRAPRAWEDLLDPRFKGKVGGFPNGTPYNYLGAGGAPWGETRALEHGKKFAANKPIWFEGGSPAIAAAIASGEIAAGAPNNIFADQWIKKGAPVDYIIPSDGTTYFQYPFCMPKEASHPNLARLIIGYWASNEDPQITEVEGWNMAYPFAQRGRLADKLKQLKLDLSVLYDGSQQKDAKAQDDLGKRIATEAFGTLK